MPPELDVVPMPQETTGPGAVLSSDNGADDALDPSPAPRGQVRVELPQLSASARTEYRAVSLSEDSPSEEALESDEGFDSDSALDDGEGFDNDGALDSDEAFDGDEDTASDEDQEGDAPPARSLPRPRARKAPPPRAGGPAPPQARGVKELNNAVGRFARQTPHLVARTKRWFATSLPPVSSFAEVERLLPRLPADAWWTDRLRRQVEEQWQQDPMRLRLLDVGGQRELLTLYKSTLRLLRCLPEDIIGCRFNLDYDTSQNRAMTTSHPSPHWSSSFCRALTALLVHPMWGGSTALLAVAIQYAVIVDSGDRAAPWDADVSGCHDAFLARLLRAKRQQPDRDVAEIRRELHDAAVPQRDIFGRATAAPVSPWDVLFQRLEQLAIPTPPEAPRRPSDPLLVHRRHLGLLERALNSMAHMGFPQFMPVEVYGRAIGGRRANKDYPQIKDFARLRAYALLCERERLAYKRARHGPADGDVELPERQDEEPPRSSQDQGRQRSHESSPSAPPSTPLPDRGQKRLHESPPAPQCTPGPGPDQKRARRDNPPRDVQQTHEREDDVAFESGGPGMDTDEAAPNRHDDSDLYAGPDDYEELRLPVSSDGNMSEPRQPVPADGGTSKLDELSESGEGSSSDGDALEGESIDADRVRLRTALRTRPSLDVARAPDRLLGTTSYVYISEET